MAMQNIASARVRMRVMNYDHVLALPNNLVVIVREELFAHLKAVGLVENVTPK